jgi:hypothetical protein
MKCNRMTRERTIWTALHRWQLKRRFDKIVSLYSINNKFNSPGFIISQFSGRSWKRFNTSSIVEQSSRDKNNRNEISMTIIADMQIKSIQAKTRLPVVNLKYPRKLLTRNILNIFTWKVEYTKWTEWSLKL